MLAWLLATPVQADHKSLYLRALAGIEKNIPQAGDVRHETARLERALEPLLFAYVERHPLAPMPRIRPVVSEVERGTAWSFDSGLILVNPYLTARLSDPVLTGVLAHELAHVALGHGWARTQMAYESVSGSAVDRLALAMTGHHPLKGSKAWSELRHGQEFQADDEARRLLAQAGLPSGWLGDAIHGVADLGATASHPSGNQRLAALTGR